MQKIIKTLLYVIIFIKVLFSLSILRYTIILHFTSKKELIEKIEKRKEIFHHAFVFLMYILLLLLFNPFQKNIKLNDDPRDSHHLQIAIFVLSIIQLINFDYGLIFKAPEEFINSL